MNRKEWLFGAVLVCIGTLFGFILSEAAARAYLYFYWSPIAALGGLGPSPKEITAIDRPRWTYDRRYGYRYPPNSVVWAARIRAGKLHECVEYSRTDANGNVGAGPPPYRPRLRIALFGDSWTAWYVDGKTIADLLAIELSVRLRHSVEIVNFARTGYGVVQMFDLAADVLNEQAFDLALFAIISDDLDRARRWGHAVSIDGEERELFLVEAMSSVGASNFLDAMIVERRISPDWCAQTQGQRDSIVEAIEERYGRLVRNAQPILNRDFALRLNQSELLLRLTSGKWFGGNPPLVRPTTLPRIDARSFAHVEGMRDNIARVKQSLIPYQIIHLAIATELNESKHDALLGSIQLALWRSLEDEVGQKILTTIQSLKGMDAQPAAMAYSDTESHPSAYAQFLYARAVADVLVRHQFVKPSQVKTDQ